MKRNLLLTTLLLCCTFSTFASTLIQGNWRWRNDNGNEATATFRAAQNAPITITDYGVLRLRVRVENPSPSSSENHGVGTLKYSTNNADQASFVNITSDETVNAFAYANSVVAPDDKAATTQSADLSTIGSGMVFAAGQYFDGRTVLDKTTIAYSTYTDLEFVIKPTSHAVPGTTYYFLIENAKDAPVPSSSHLLARLTTAAVLPVNFLTFEAKPVNNSVQLKWSTASEKNNDRFEISRSEDAKTWQVIGTEKGKGNSDATSAYTLTDRKPLSGTSYYQLAQFDNDGTKTVLATKSVNLSLDAAVEVNVFPNPTAKEINVSIANYVGKNVQVSLLGQDGKLIHKEQFDNDLSSKKLNISTMPSPGVYILKVQGQKLSVNKKIVIL